MRRPPLALLPLALLLAGCPPAPVQPNSGTAAAVGDILKDVKASVDEMRKTNEAVATALNSLVQAHSKTEQFVADAVARSRYYNDQNPAQNSFTQLIGKELGTAAAAGPVASAESQQQAVDNLKLSLSQSEADKAALAAKLQQQLLEAENLRGQVKAKTQDADTAQAAAKVSDAAVTAKVNELASAKTQIDINAAEADQARKDKDKEAAAHTRLKIAAGCMAAGVGIIVLAVVATFLHVPGVLAVGLFTGFIVFGIGWAITYVENLLEQVWFQWAMGIMIFGSVVAIVWVGVAALRTRKKAALTEKGFTAVVGALQDARNDDARFGTTKFAAVAPHLTEWMVDDRGQPDAQLQAHIDQKVVAMNLKNPNGAAPVPVVAVSAVPAPISAPGGVVTGSPTPGGQVAPPPPTG